MNLKKFLSKGCVVAGLVLASSCRHRESANRVQLPPELVVAARVSGQLQGSALQLVSEGSRELAPHPVLTRWVATASVASPEAVGRVLLSPGFEQAAELLASSPIISSEMPIAARYPRAFLLLAGVDAQALVRRAALPEVVGDARWDLMDPEAAAWVLANVLNDPPENLRPQDVLGFAILTLAAQEANLREIGNALGLPQLAPSLNLFEMSPQLAPSLNLLETSPDGRGGWSEGIGLVFRGLKRCVVDPVGMTQVARAGVQGVKSWWYKTPFLDFNPEMLKTIEATVANLPNSDDLVGYRWVSLPVSELRKRNVDLSLIEPTLKLIPGAENISIKARLENIASDILGEKIELGESPEVLLRWLTGDIAKMHQNLLQGSGMDPKVLADTTVVLTNVSRLIEVALQHRGLWNVGHQMGKWTAGDSAVKVRLEAVDQVMQQLGTDEITAFRLLTMRLKAFDEKDYELLSKVIGEGGKLGQIVGGDRWDPAQVKSVFEALAAIDPSRYRKISSVLEAFDQIPAKRLSLIMATSRSIALDASMVKSLSTIPKESQKAAEEGVLKLQAAVARTVTEAVSEGEIRLLLGFAANPQAELTRLGAGKKPQDSKLADMQRSLNSVEDHAAFDRLLSQANLGFDLETQEKLRVIFKLNPDVAKKLVQGDDVSSQQLIEVLQKKERWAQLFAAKDALVKGHDNKLRAGVSQYLGDLSRQKGLLSTKGVENVLKSAKALLGTFVPNVGQPMMKRLAAQTEEFYDDLRNLGINLQQGRIPDAGLLDRVGKGFAKLVAIDPDGNQIAAASPEAAQAVQRSLLDSVSDRPTRLALAVLTGQIDDQVFEDLVVSRDDAFVQELFGPTLVERLRRSDVNLEAERPDLQRAFGDAKAKMLGVGAPRQRSSGRGAMAALAIGAFGAGMVTAGVAIGSEKKQSLGLVHEADMVTDFFASLEAKLVHERSR